MAEHAHSPPTSPVISEGHRPGDPDVVDPKDHLHEYGEDHAAPEKARLIPEFGVKLFAGVVSGVSMAMVGAAFLYMLWFLILERPGSHPNSKAGVLVLKGLEIAVVSSACLFAAFFAALFVRFYQKGVEGPPNDLPRETFLGTAVGAAAFWGLIFLLDPMPPDPHAGHQPHAGNVPGKKPPAQEVIDREKQKAADARANPAGNRVAAGAPQPGPQTMTVNEAAQKPKPNEPLKGPAVAGDEAAKQKAAKREGDGHYDPKAATQHKSDDKKDHHADGTPKPKHDDHAKDGGHGAHDHDGHKHHEATPRTAAGQGVIKVVSYIYKPIANVALLQLLVFVLGTGVAAAVPCFFPDRRSRPYADADRAGHGRVAPSDTVLASREHSGEERRPTH